LNLYKRITSRTTLNIFIISTILLQISTNYTRQQYSASADKDYETDTTCSELQCKLFTSCDQVE